MVEPGSGTSIDCGASESCEFQGDGSVSCEGDDPSSTSNNFSGLGSCCVELSLLTGDTDPPLKSYLCRHLKHIVELEGVTQCELSVAVVDVNYMAQLHRSHLGCEGPTDVLTFDLRDIPAWGGSGAALEGDIVICRDIAVQRASQHGHDARAELLLYAVHGLLHLTGHDDRNPRQAAAMHAREDELLTIVGVGPIYAKGEPQ